MKIFRIPLLIAALLVAFSSIERAASQSSTSPAKYNATLCALNGPFVSWVGQWTHAAHKYLSSRYSRTSWELKQYGVKNNNDTATFLKSKEAEGCDFVISPGYSDLMYGAAGWDTRAPIIDAGATSSAFSSKANYPFFTRTVPSDALTAQYIVSILRLFQWKSVTLVVSSDAYGDSVMQALHNALHRSGENGGCGDCFIEQVVDVPFIPTISDSDYQRLLEGMLLSHTRVIVFAVPVLSFLEQIAAKMSTYDPENSQFFAEKFIFLHMDISSSALMNMPGSLFPGAVIDDAVLAPFWHYASQIPASEYEAEVSSKAGVTRLDIGGAYPTDSAPFYEAALFESIRLVFDAVEAAVIAGNYNGKNASFDSISHRTSLIRERRIPDSASYLKGVTLGARAEPISMQIEVNNVFQFGKSRVIKILTSGFTTSSSSSSTDTSSSGGGTGITPVYLMGQEYRFGEGTGGTAAFPSELRVIVTAVDPQKARSRFTDDEKRILSIALPILIGITVISLGVVYWEKVTDIHRFAPKSESKPLFVVKSRIYRCAILWELYPTVMKKVVLKHNALLRHLIHKHKGYEIISSKAEDFLIVFQSSDDALDFCTDAQVTFVKQNWDEAAELDGYYTSLDSQRSLRRSSVTTGKKKNPSGKKKSGGKKKGRGGEKENSSNLPNASDDDDDDGFEEEWEYRQLWNGPRLCMGVGMGLLSIQKDYESRRYDYFGPVLDEVHEVVEATKGGQICMSESCVDHLKRAHNAVFTTVGAIRNERGEVRAMQCTPYQLQGRKFVSDLRIGFDRSAAFNQLDEVIEFDDMGASGGGSGGGGPAGGGGTSASSFNLLGSGNSGGAGHSGGSAAGVGQGSHLHLAPAIPNPLFTPFSPPGSSSHNAPRTDATGSTITTNNRKDTNTTSSSGSGGVGSRNTMLGSPNSHSQDMATHRE